MNVICVTAENFASYKDINVIFSHRGLTLIQGATGSGKSTLCDLIPWALFGRTAKGGAVDEIVSWHGGVTKVMASMDSITVYRSRGKNAKDNDLYYRTNEGYIIRGKDLQDTQNKINSLLGMNFDLYLSGSYFHEFSQTAQFFITTAKNRRVICEQLVDLSMAKNLQLKSSDSRKLLQQDVNKLELDMQKIQTEIGLLERLQITENTKADTWYRHHEQDLLKAVSDYHRFEANRVRTVTDKKCPTCSTSLVKGHTITDTSVNPYLSRLESLEKESNPHTDGAKDFTDQIIKLNEALLILVNANVKVTQQLTDVELFEDILHTFRRSLITHTISFVQDTTNQLLSDYFDAELRVEFEAEEADKLEVTISKDSNICAYSQLSKGQRQILKLCFSIAVMKQVATNNNANFYQLFFDEALDGLDDNFKAKAFRLFESLSTQYPSVFVVEHSSELKAMFPNRMNVQLIDGKSYVESK